jgi:mRNA-degrading endonuclease YafQ of YafQ-DinJ toxin-antitoxin module|nr:hypothetical protein [Neorhizobium tomejilense]
MRGITNVIQTDLFWDSLGDLRGTPYYAQAIANIMTCINNKMTNRDHVGGNDRPFSAQKELRGIWHAHILKSPLKVFFYTIEGDTLTMAKVGDHDDYGWKGKNSGAAERLALRIANAARRGHVPYADWEAFRWNTPSTVLSHPDIALMSRQSLDRLDSALSEEGNSLELLSRSYGGDVSRIPVDDAIEWISEIENARERLAEIMAARHTLNRAFKNGRHAAFALSEPTQEQVQVIAHRLQR